MVRSAEVTQYWVDQVGPAGWYKQDPALDDDIRQKFQDTWEWAASVDCEGRALDQWIATPEGVLGLLILLDQFPRNMFREDSRAFATDKRARAIAKKAIEMGWDKRVPCPERQFFYLPLMHSECLSDQDRAVRLMKTRMEGEGGQVNLLHARVHREIIREFGRFPFRNAALSRKPTGAEADFLAQGGYGRLLHSFEALAA